MVIFDDLYINEAGDKLIINAHMDEAEWFEDMYISELIIDTQNTYLSSNTPSSSPIYSKLFTNVYDILEGEDIKGLDKKELNKYNTRRISLILDKRDFGNIPDFSKNIYFVYIKVGGIPKPDTPCGKDQINHLGVSYYKKPILASLIGDISGFTKDCGTPSRVLIDSILKFKSLETSIKVGAFSNAIRFWNKFYKDKNNPVGKGCGCK